MDPRRETRRLAMQLLYAIDLGRLGEKQPDAESPTAASEARESVQSPLSSPDHGVLLDAIDAEFNANAEVREAAARLAIEAWTLRAKADAICAELAPDWPPSRQPAVDRSILRLALYEIASGRTPMKVAINEAVELAKHYAGEDSPMFINAVLDKAAARLPVPPAGETGAKGAEGERSVAASLPSDVFPARSQATVDPNRWLDDALHAAGS
ncbi:MAG: transcription antitermination factor NusB [Phycisphaeraceae bacterium]